MCKLLRTCQLFDTRYTSRCCDVKIRRPTKLCTISGRLLCYGIHFWGSCPLTEFCQVQNSLCVQVLRSPILAALLHGTRAAAVSQTLWRVGGMELRNFRRGHHLYSAWRPSRWASAHILVMKVLGRGQDYETGSRYLCWCLS